MPVAGSRPEGSSGRFWLAGSPERTVGGWLDLSSRSPVVELAEPLTPSMREVSRTEQPNGSLVVRAVPADDDVQPDRVTVHGLLRDGPPRGVTLIDAFNVGRVKVWGGVVNDPGMERLQSAYALLGGRVAGRDVRFRFATLTMQHLDVWAQLPGIMTEVVTDGSRAVVTHERPDEESTELSNPAGRLVLDTVLTMSPPTVRRAGLTRTAQLRWEGSGEGLTLEELWARFVDPLRVLLTLAVDADSPVVSLEVREATGDRWLQVVHPGLGQGNSELLPAHEVLLSRQHLSLHALGNWLSRAPVLSPIPRLVTGVAVSSSERTVENQLLELAAAAEGLHRRLHPRQQTMTKNQARKTRRAAVSAVPQEAQSLVREVLGHLEEPTYRARLRVLVARGCEAAPGVIGDTAEWTDRIVSARNGFAHHLVHGKRAEAELEDHLVLLRSLRWLLTSLLLLEAGVAPEALAARLAQHQPYLHFRRQAQRCLPAVYRETEAPSSVHT